MTYIGRVSISSAQDRLERLIDERLRKGSDKQAVDRRIWDLFGEEWTVMCTDLAGFSKRSNDFGIIHFLQTIVESQRIFVPVIDRHEGILLKVEADSLLLIFRSTRKALECAVEMVRQARQYNVGRIDAEQILICVGVGVGTMLRIGEHDVYGQEVNSASKLGEDTAKPWEILVTSSVRTECVSVPDVEFLPIEDAPSSVGEAYRLVYGD